MDLFKYENSEHAKLHEPDLQPLLVIVTSPLL
jgi:hypothetical protein